MQKAPLYNGTGEPAGEVELAEAVFGRRSDGSLVHLAVVRELANRRQGTHDTKSRSEVSGGGKKPYRQKGTGRARQGSTRSPQWRHGGIVHGPTPRSYRKGMPRKMRRAALLAALSGKAADGAVRVLEGLAVDAISTRALRQTLDRLELTGRTMLVVAEPDSKLVLSARNLPNLSVRILSQPGNGEAEAAEGEEGAGEGRFQGLSTYEVVNADTLLFTRAALDRLQEVYAE